MYVLNIILDRILRREEVIFKLNVQIFIQGNTGILEYLIELSPLNILLCV